MQLEQVKEITKRISIKFMGQDFQIRVERDNKRPEDGRIFVQVVFNSPCSKDGVVHEWHSRKWYLSDHMTTDEIVKTCYASFKMAIEHELMESFKVDNIILFNPHINFETLLKVSNDEVVREKKEVDELSKYRKSGKLDSNGVEILEGSIINADGYDSDLENNMFHCVEVWDGEFGSDIYSDFEPLSSYKTITVVGHCSQYKHRMNDKEFDWSGNLGAVMKN